ncbi:hypothetical protein T03_2672 [Trichinella britovi]|uniref:Uncharacterized protein n=1 Tax=Trichinella britovi TaxID=45882 RepID=A0A0V1C7B7_TRIBR|nr:hypothetical protein T03_2672 [Trichinella britovi]
MENGCFGNIGHYDVCMKTIRQVTVTDDILGKISDTAVCHTEHKDFWCCGMLAMACDVGSALFHHAVGANSDACKVLCAERVQA